MAFIPTASIIEIIVAGVIYTIIAVFVQRKLSNPKKMREIQDQIKVYTKELNAMIKNNMPKEEIAKKQAEMMPLMKQSLSLNMKSMFILLPSFLVVYYLIIPFVFGYLGTSTIVFSLIGNKITLEYRGVFFVTVFVLGIFSSIGVLLYDRRRAKLDTKAKLEAEGIKD